MMYVLMLTSLMGICSTQWVTLWVILEMNTLSMCFLISKEKKKSKDKENVSLLYFLTQVLCSICILIASNMQHSPLTQMVLCTAIMMKMGSWPTHLWYMKLINLMELKETPLMLIMTWQKILPTSMILMMKMTLINLTILMGMAFMSILVATSQLKKELSMKSILGLSSLNNNGWLTITCLISPKILMLYLLLYSPSLILLMMKMKKMKTIEKNHPVKFWETSMMMMNLSGLPPMTMFWGKLMVVKNMMNTNFPKESVFILILTSCVFLYFYMTMLSVQMTKMVSKFPLPLENPQKTSIIPPLSMLGVCFLLL
uniref:NADH dehydrogenase subunit 2 n=1 Tax=Chortoglyphus arcuatus TaxID=66564 RepID=UPI00220CB172|nr:NADH dehydrogenase subunit 2 [Chortoglyphus arcuatus]UBQ34117.1 NADH dehydrogenase subunit 2 [Chortoglyphus arcuatus]